MTIKQKSLILSVVLASCSTAFAQQNYNASELKGMVAGGNLPALGSVINSQSKQLAFMPCKQLVTGMMSQLRSKFPVQVVIDGSDQYVAKAWTADGMIEASCSAADKAMQMAKKAYQ